MGNCLFGRDVITGSGAGPTTSGWNWLRRPSKNSKEEYYEEEEAYVIGGTNDAITYSLKDLPAKETWKVTLSRDVNGNKIVNEYVIIKTLGRGSYGKVKLCINLLNEEFYAIKIFHKGVLRRKRIGMSTALQDVVREIAIMKKLNHKNIVKLYDIINDSDHEKLYMVMEYVSGGPIINLEDEDVEPLPEELCKKYFADIISGLEYLHKQKIVHRDIKPENLLVSEDGVIKISDFGVSHVFNDEDDSLTRSAGSPAFLAPELCTTGATASGKAVDVWASGVTLYSMIYGRVPFIADNVIEIYEVIKSLPLTFPEEPKISPELKDLLVQVLDKDPETRITIADIKVHPWLTGDSFEKQAAKDSDTESSISTVSATPSEIQNAVSNSFVSFVKFKSGMKRLSERARSRLAETVGYLPNFSNSDSETDPSDSYATTTSTTTATTVSTTPRQEVSNTRQRAESDTIISTEEAQQIAQHQMGSRSQSAIVLPHTSKSVTSAPTLMLHGSFDEDLVRLSEWTLDDIMYVKEPLEAEEEATE